MADAVTDAALTVQITLDKALPDISINCPGGCSAGGRSYGIYEGTIANVRASAYDHVAVGCSEVCPGSNPFIPGAGDRYYLVVPHNFKEEGYYGNANLGGGPVARPQASSPANRCSTLHNTSPCP